MSVATFNPAGITATTAAVRHIGRQMALSGRPYLRLGVKQAGCNGYMYTLDHLDEPGADDQAFPVDDGLALYVRRDDLALVRGTEVDLVTEGLNSILKFKNPNAAAHCGCGESFSLNAGAPDSPPANN